MTRIVTFGEIMLRLSPPDQLRFTQARSFDVIYGGGESNVAVSLAHFGMRNRLCHPLASQRHRRSLPELTCASLGLGHAISCVAANAWASISWSTAPSMRGSKVIYDRAGSALATIQPGMIDWDAAFDGAGWFHWTGITPAISEGAAAVCLEAVKAARDHGLTISTDLNYRKKLWKWGKNARRGDGRTGALLRCRHRQRRRRRQGLRHPRAGHRCDLRQVGG